MNMKLDRLDYPTAPKNRPIILQTFIDGARDLETQQTLRLGNPKKMEDIFLCTLEIEAIQVSRSYL